MFSANNLDILTCQTRDKELLEYPHVTAYRCSIYCDELFHTPTIRFPVMGTNFKRLYFAYWHCVLRNTDTQFENNKYLTNCAKCIKWNMDNWKLIVYCETSKKVHTEPSTYVTNSNGVQNYFYRCRKKLLLFYFY